METVTASKEFHASPMAMIEHCRTLASRQAWPGSQLMGKVGPGLMFQVSMRLKSAEMTEIEIKETPGEVQEHADGTVSFRSTQRVSWPDGTADAECEYVCTPGSPNMFTFTYRYEAPGGKLVKKKALPAFHEGMQKVAGAYAARLTAAVDS